MEKAETNPTDKGTGNRTILGHLLRVLFVPVDPAALTLDAETRK